MIIQWLIVFVLFSSICAERNPFVFSHELSVSSERTLTNNTAEQHFSPDWRIIACDGSRLTIQHTDGTIRIISLINDDNFPKRNPSNLR